MHTTKHEWRKSEKNLYMPKTTPALIDIPSYQYITIKGHGSPEETRFSNCISALYPLAYAIKMNLKTMQNKPPSYQDYTVYPLEGFWDLNDDAKSNFTGEVRKADFIYTLMLRQPSFITEEFYSDMKQVVKDKLSKKGESTEFVEGIEFEKIVEGQCVQMLHIGKFADEDKTFKIMEDFVSENGLTRTSKTHKEIYLSDFRKVPENKLKTTLRFKVK